jgi:hypothetical protein
MATFYGIAHPHPYSLSIPAQGLSYSESEFLALSFASIAVNFYHESQHVVGTVAGHAHSVRTGHLYVAMYIEEPAASMFADKMRTGQYTGLSLEGRGAVGPDGAIHHVGQPHSLSIVGSGEAARGPLCRVYAVGGAYTIRTFRRVIEAVDAVLAGLSPTGPWSGIFKTPFYLPGAGVLLIRALTASHLPHTYYCRSAA